MVDGLRCLTPLSTIFQLYRECDTVPSLKIRTLFYKVNISIFYHFLVYGRKTQLRSELHDTGMYIGFPF
jgi:hypothetical protein